MKKNRIIGGILAAALAIVPFTGTGIDSIDKELTKETAITADAYGNSNMTRGYYYVNRDFTCTSGAYGPVSFKRGQYIFIDTDGWYKGCMMEWYASIHWEVPVPFISLAWSV